MSVSRITRRPYQAFKQLLESEKQRQRCDGQILAVPPIRSVDCMISRRNFILSLAATALLARTPFARASGTAITVTKDPNCGCCTAWADQLRTNRFAVKVVDNPAISRVKARLGVPSQLASCHTAEIERYVIEGHVPASSIRRLLAERPAIRGLALPGMPVGSPGMEVEGTPPETYEVIAFGPGGQTIVARYEGTKELPVL